MWRSARSISCANPVAVNSRAIASRSSRPIASFRSRTASSRPTRLVRAFLAASSAEFVSVLKTSARASSSRSSRLNVSSPAPSWSARASPALTNCPLATQSPFSVTKTSPVRSDFVIASSRLAASRAFIFSGSVRRRTATSSRGAPSRSEIFRSSAIVSVANDIESAGRSSTPQANALVCTFDSSLPP